MRNKSRGFTLMEVMTVVVIVGILAAIALPTYSEYTRRAHRTDAMRGLMEAASAMERYFSQNQTYATASLGSATTDVYPAASPDGYYTLSLVKTATTYTLTATATGSQAGDECGNFTLNHLSVKGVSPPSGATISLSARECWKMN